MGFRLTKLGLLMWKNLILFRRRPWITSIELGLPLLFACILTMTRAMTDTTDYDNYTIFDPVDVSLGDQIPKTYIGNAPFEFCYAPKSPATDDVMERFLASLQEDYPWMKNYSIQSFESKSDLIAYYNVYKLKMPIAFHFHDVGPNTQRVPNNIKYAVMPMTLADDKWMTHYTFKNILCNPLSDEDYCDFDFPDFRERGVLTMLRVMDESIMRHWGSEPGRWSIQTQCLPLPDFEQDPIVERLGFTLPGLVMFSFVVTVIVLTKAIVHEKQTQLKESMKMMGLTSSTYWLSWFLTYTLWMVVVMVLYVVVGMIVTIKHADASVLMVYMIVYGITIVSFCFMISVFVQNANLGAIIACIVYVATFLPQYFLDFDDLSQSTKIASSLLFNTGLAWGMKTLVYYDETGEGVQWDNLDKAPSVDHEYSLSDSMLMMVADTAIHLLVAWYVDNVYPGDYGMPKPFYFMFTKSYWFPNHKANYDSQNSVIMRDPRYFEEDPSLKAGIRITDLRKEYGDKVVVEGTTVNMFEDQITVLLGHNGAGKSTTIGMLTGLTQPTSGTALINGYDIWTETESVRSSLGLCPQHNILFDTLTVQEHLVFFAVLKGMSRSEAKEEAEKYVGELGLKGKEMTQSQHLSGGQKRKLSVGVALIAGSKVVVLDEPSSGLDPGARRQMWEMLQRNKDGRTMLLTTHYMEEADVLGDRILIMAKGVVQCAGSSMFLKKLYGEGYHLILVKGDKFDADAVTKIIATHIPNSYLEEEVGCEASYHLPNADSKRFPGLLRELEKHQAELGLDGFGTTATTMEEVFLKVGEDSNATPHMLSGDHNNSIPQSNLQDMAALDATPKTALIEMGNGHTKGSPFEENSGLDHHNQYKKKSSHDLVWTRVKAMLHKKALYCWRSKMISVLQILLPIGFTVAALVIGNNIPDVREEKEIPFDLSDFDDTVTVYSDGLKPTTLTSQLADYYYRYVKDIGEGDEFVKVDRKEWPDLQRYFLDDRIHAVGMSSFNQKYVTGVTFEPGNNMSSNASDATGFFSTRPWHSEPIALVELMNSLVTKVMGQGYSIRTNLDPMPKPGKDQADDIMTHSGSVSSVVSMFTGLGMGFIVSSFVFTIIQERQVGSKHLQTVSGVSPMMYWGPTFLWDFVNFIIPALIIVVVLVIADEGAFVDNDDGIVSAILLFVMYGWACIPYSYLMQFVFDNATSGFTMIFMFNIFTCIFSTMAVLVVQVTANDRDVDEIVRTAVSIPFPSASLCLAIMELYQNYNNKDFCESSDYSRACDMGVVHPCCKNTCEDTCLDFQDSVLSMDVPAIGRFILFLFIQGCVSLTLLALKEYHYFDRLVYFCSRKEDVSEASPLLYTDVSRPSDGEDSDVVREKVRIEHMAVEDCTTPGSLVVKDLCKQYGDFMAVDHLHVGVERQQCFGLLGENGAGKTSTFNMLTGRTMVTGGNAYMGGWGIKDNLNMAQSNMGYCPQFDALANQLTGRETLTFYGRVKGIPDDSLKDIIVSLMDGLGFRPHIDKLVGNYSGGNKRKLSTAVALLGDPDFLFLDEPSSGMDPAARRHLWDVLGMLRESGKTLVLTSHSMEECDALCTQIAIMVNGKFKCLGSPQHLKNKFGQGYILKAKLVESNTAAAGTTPASETSTNLYTTETGGSDTSQMMSPLTRKVVNFIRGKIPDAKVFDVHQGYLHMQVPEGSAMLSDLFKVMEKAKKRSLVHDYFVHQTSLEQVFLSFARHQNVRHVIPPRSCWKKCCCCC